MNKKVQTDIGDQKEFGSRGSAFENSDALQLALHTQLHSESSEIVRTPVRIPMLFDSSGLAVPISTIA